MADLYERSNMRKIKKEKSKKRRSIFSNILLVVCIVVFCYSSYRLIKSGLDTYKSKKENNKMADIFYGPTPTQTPTVGTTVVATPTPKPETLEEKFTRLTAINGDIKAWINVVNTNIDYAVVQASDNDYYLRRNIYKKYSYSGSIFMDYRCSIWDKPTKNIIIYGHNMKADTMFHELQKFKKESFFKDESNIITLYTSEGIVKAKVFSVYITGITKEDFQYLQATFDDASKYQAYLDTAVSKSKFKSSTSVYTDDRIITLSTCDYEFDDARLVVHAKIIQ